MFDIHRITWGQWQNELLMNLDVNSGPRSDCCDLYQGTVVLRTCYCDAADHSLYIDVFRDQRGRETEIHHVSPVISNLISACFGLGRLAIPSALRTRAHVGNFGISTCNITEMRATVLWQLHPTLLISNGPMGVKSRHYAITCCFVTCNCILETLTLTSTNHHIISYNSVILRLDPIFHFEHSSHMWLLQNRTAPVSPP